MGLIKSSKLEMSVDIVQVFTALTKVLEPIDVYIRTPIPHQLIGELGLKDRDEYLAMKACGFLMWDGLDWGKAHELLGEERVDTWMKHGTYSDDFHPMANKNLDYWYDPESRQKYYEEYIANNTTLRRTGSAVVKLHRNFTIAEIEHAMRNK